MLKAAYDRVIVSLEYEEATKGGIVIPDSAKQYSGDFWGIVEAAGPDNHDGLKKGDKVFFRRHEGWRFEREGRKYLCLRARWILAKEGV